MYNLYNVQNCVYILLYFLKPNCKNVNELKRYKTEDNCVIFFLMIIYYERKVRTVPLTNPLHIGHLRNEGAHSLHTTKCPQGMKTMLTSLSMHTLHVRSSCSLLSCSSIGKSVKMSDMKCKSL